MREQTDRQRDRTRGDPHHAASLHQPLQEQGVWEEEDGTTSPSRSPGLPDVGVDGPHALCSRSVPTVAENKEVWPTQHR